MLSLNAQEHQKQMKVSVSGEGIVRAIPDQVVINIRIEHTGNSAKEVKAKNDVAVDKVLKFCKRMKIADKDVHTQYINLNKNYNYQKKEYQYNSNQAIRILLRNIDEYETVIQGVLDSGTNRIDGITFKSSQMEKYKSEARVKAVQNARKKAVEYAGALNQEVGKALIITENTGYSNPVPPMMRSKSLEMTTDQGSTGITTIAVGEMKISATVQVTFALN